MKDYVNTLLLLLILLQVTTDEMLKAIIIIAIIANAAIDAYGNLTERVARWRERRRRCGARNT